MNPVCSERPRAGLTVLLCALLLVVTVPASAQSPATTDQELRQMLQQSLRDRGGVSVARVIDQDAVQSLCSQPASARSAAALQALRDAQQASVRMPADDAWLGDWREGEKIAQSGRGLQFNDAPGQPNGGNCYACHQLSAGETAYGTLGPSLLAYGRLHGRSQEQLHATWVRLYNPQALTPCSIMPRFGQHGILTEQQLRDLMALLFDPDSPVNR